MRSLKTGLTAIAISGLLTTAAIVGCSADGGSTIATEAEPTDPGTGAQLPPPSENPDNTPADSGSGTKKDSGTGKTDSGVDAGPPPPVAGTACTKVDEIKYKTCGACGKASTVCLDDGTGKKTWSDYSACEGELAGGCIPGTVVDEPCGNCGTVKKTCTQYCAFTSGSCTGQPPSSCKPGTIEYSTAGCAASTYRNRTCGTACTWGGFSASCAEPNNPNKMTASLSVGAVVTQAWSLDAANVTKRPYSCSASSSFSSANLPYVAVEVANPGATSIEVSLYHSGSPEVDTLIWYYSKTLPPTTDAELAACVGSVKDSCITGNPCGGANSLDWAGIDKVVIPANGKILVYSSGYSASDTGAFNLNIRTDKVN